MISALRLAYAPVSKATSSLISPNFGLPSNAIKFFGLPSRLLPSLTSNRSKCSGENCTRCQCFSGKRGISTNQADENLVAPKPINQTEISSNDVAGILASLKQSYPSVAEKVDIFPIAKAEKAGNNLKLTLASGEVLQYPTIWLRDNCQCTDCFHPLALGRSLLMENLFPSPEVEDAHVGVTGDVHLTWTDGHKSVFQADWLERRAFTEQARQKYRSRFSLPKKQWSSDHKLEKFSYPSLMSDDVALLSWLVHQETWGATLLKQVPPNPAAAYDLCERMAKVKYTHFGDYSNVVNHPNANNLAYTSQALNLHNDMPQYQEQPGLIFLHMIKQHLGEGGDSIISDGLRAAEDMRQNHREEFDILTSTDVYFWDKGDGKDGLEMQQFLKLNRGPTIQLDNRGEVSIIRFNNQVRDSFLDLPAEKVEKFYDALKIYFNYMYQHSINFKMSNGDMTILDNMRCQHARKAFVGNESARHLSTTFMSWDEALCRRRRLQEQFGL